MAVNSRPAGASQNKGELKDVFLSPGNSKVERQEGGAFAPLSSCQHQSHVLRVDRRVEADLKNLKVAYFHTPTMSKKKYESMVSLLEIFAQHLSLVANQLLKASPTPSEYRFRSGSRSRFIASKGIRGAPRRTSQLPAESSRSMCG